MTVSRSIHVPEFLVIWRLRCNKLNHFKDFKNSRYSINIDLMNENNDWYIRLQHLLSSPLRVSTSRGKVRSQRNYFIALISFDPKRGSAFPKKRPWCCERLKAGGKGDDRGWDGWHHQLNGHEFEQTPGDADEQESLVCCSPCGHKELDMTERLNWTEVLLVFENCKACQVES